ncbi:MAG: Mov34/MPN/PAD-1 family protein [Promethearchaeota archaeon]|jgi:proteasome lid subunit RPN8/RPN11
MSINEDFVFPVYIKAKVLDEITEISKTSPKEIFGYLVGDILKWKEKIYVRIEAQIFILGALYSEKYSFSQIEGTAGAYNKKFNRLKKKRKFQNLRIVGWWHTHPGLGCFLSEVDLKTQKFFFPESYQIALVIDPLRSEYKIFTLDKQSEKKYKEVSNAVISATL